MECGTADFPSRVSDSVGSEVRVNGGATGLGGVKRERNGVKRCREAVERRVTARNGM